MVSFKLTLDESKAEDLIIYIQGLRFLIDPYTRIFIFKKLKIDYQDPNGFVIVDQ